MNHNLCVTLEQNARDPRGPLHSFPRASVRIEEDEELVSFPNEKDVWPYLRQLSQYLNHIYDTIRTEPYDFSDKLHGARELAKRELPTIGVRTNATKPMTIEMHDIAPVEIQKALEPTPLQRIGHVSPYPNIYNPNMVGRHNRTTGFHIYMKLYKEPLFTKAGRTIGFIMWDVPMWLNPYVL